MTWPRLLADLTVIVHAAYVSFVVLGQLAIVIGLALQQPWARNWWFRLIHLGMITVVVLESWIGLACPLTTLENALRQQAGQATHAGSFVGDWAHRLIFVRADPWMFTVAYSLFGLAVAATFLLGPPRWPRRPLDHDRTA
jgi:hypothetical protein